MTHDDLAALNLSSDNSPKRKPSRLSQAMRAIQFDSAGKELARDLQREKQVEHKHSPGHIYSGTGFRIRAAATREEREAAYCFVQKTYEQKGFSSSDEPPLRIKLQYALPGALTLLAHDNEDRVIGTLTIVPDSELGLPMSESFGADLAKLRAAGKKICEYTGLCVVGATARVNQQILLNLYRAAWLYASQGLCVTDICVVVNPRHEHFYRKVFFYEPFGEAQSCAHVQGAPGVPLVQNVQTMIERSSTMQQAGMGDLYDFFFGDEQKTILPRLEKTVPRMPRNDFLYFFTEKTRLWQKATPAEKNCLLSALKEPALAATQF